VAQECLDRFLKTKAILVGDEVYLLQSDRAHFAQYPFFVFDQVLPCQTKMISERRPGVRDLGDANLLSVNLRCVRVCAAKGLRDRFSGCGQTPIQVIALLLVQLGSVILLDRLHHLNLTQGVAESIQTSGRRKQK